MSFRFHLLGGVELTGIGQADVRAVLTQPKRLALLAYILLAEPRGFQRRDTLLALFWPDLGMEEARRALRQSLHFLRQHLGPDALINRGAEEVAAAREEVRCDAIEFRELLAEGKEEEALARYRGDLLPGFHVDGAAPEFEEWLEQARTELRRQALAAMRRVVDRHVRESRPADAAHWAGRIMALPIAEERDLVRAMQLFRDAGDTGAAREVYDAHARRLKAQYGSEPGPAAKALRLELRAPGAPGAPPVPPPTPQPSPEPPLPAPVAPVTGLPRKTGTQWRWWAAGLVATAVAVAALAWRARPSSPGRAADAVAAPPRIAVAVFVNQTGDSTLEPLGTMVSDWVMRGLTRVTPLHVVDVGAVYASGRTPAGAPREARALAAENGASLAVAGTYYLTGADSLLFSARVLDVATGEVLRKVDSVWSVRAAPLAGAPELGDRLTSAVWSIVNPQAFHISASVQPPAYEAFREYVRGAELYWSGRFQEALPLIRRAGEMDPAFSWARVFTGVVAAGVGRCDLVDSLASRLLSEGGNLQELERVTLDISTARCRTDWFEALRQQRRRIELLPGATFPRWGAAVAARQANRPATAMAIFETVDPVHGLGWLGQGRTLYWLHVTAALHALGEYERERHLADSLLRVGQDPLAATYYLARSLAGLGRDDGLPEVLSGAGGLPPDPALLAGQTPGRLRATELATPGYLLYEAGAELAAHGRPGPSRALATRAIEWLSTGDPDAVRTVERRYLLGRALLLADRPSEARAVFDELSRAEPAVPEYRALAGVAAARQGDRRSAEAAIRWLATLRHPWPPGLAPYYRAAITAALGDIPGALDLIEGLPNGSHPYDFIQFHVDPILSPLHGTERFRRFISPKG